MKKKILIVQPLHQRAMERLDACENVDYEVVTDLSEENLIEKVADVDAITVRVAKLSEKVIEQAKSCKVISRHGVGYDNIPVKLCSKLKIPVTIVGSANSISVAEHTMYLLFAAAKVGIELDSATRGDRFSERSNLLGVELNGKTLLLIGYGRIGKEVARRAMAFGMRVIVFDPYIKGSKDEEITFINDLDEALKQANAVSLHVPLSDETRNIIGARELAQLPKRAIVVNASRGGLIDEAALIEAVSSGSIHGAGLDTFAIEPLPADSPLVEQKRIVLSPHSAALTEESLVAMSVKTIDNALDGINGSLDPELIVNKEILEQT